MLCHWVLVLGVVSGCVLCLWCWGAGVVDVGEENLLRGGLCWGCSGNCSEHTG